MSKKLPAEEGCRSLDLDAALYTKKMMAKCVVKPDLNEIDIQDAYGVSCAEDVLGNMLTSGEDAALSNKLLDVNGFNEIFEDEVKEDKKLIKGGDADSNYAYYCLHELHLLPKSNI